MKKAITFFLIIVVLLTVAFFTASILFKKRIITAVKNSLEQKANAKIEYTDYNLSFIKNFPNAIVELKHVKIIINEKQEKDTLLTTQLAKGKVNLTSLIKSEVQVKEIVFVKPEINWIAGKLKTQEKVTQKHNQNKKDSSTNTKQKTNSKINWQLDKLEIQNAILNYKDTGKHIQATLSGININIAGKMFGDSTQLKAQSSIEDILFSVNDVKYISKTKLKLITSANANLKKMHFNIAENKLLVNQLPLAITGSFAIPNDTAFANLQIKTQTPDFNNFLALMPSVYKSYLNDITTEGSAVISTSVNGFFYKNEYPDIKLKLKVNDGKLKFSNKPKTIKNIKIDAQINKPQGSLDLTEITVKKAHIEIENDSVNLNLKIITPVSDAYFKGNFNGKINLTNLQQALPTDSANVSGDINANISAEGSYSAIEQDAYDKVLTDGTVMLNNFIYESPNLTRKIIVPKGKLKFSSRSILLNSFCMNIGDSDFRVSGKVSNYLNYCIKKGTILGTLQLKSNFINTNELLRLKASPSRAKTASTKRDRDKKTKETPKENIAFDIPKNVNITFNTRIKKAIVNKIIISDINGKIETNNQILYLEKLNMNMLGGSMAVDGSYKNTYKNQPLVNLNLDVNNFDFPTMCNSISQMQKLLPGANNNSTGQLSAKLEMKGQLTPQMKFIPESKNGHGMLNGKNIKINDSKMFKQLDNILDKNKLQNIYIDDFTAYFTITNGNISLQPFTTRIIGQETKIAGSLDYENTLDMRLDFNVERQMFGSDIQKMLSIIPGNEKITMLPTGVNIKGPLENPELNIDLSATQKAVTEATKDDIKKSLNKLGEGLKKIFH